MRPVDQRVDFILVDALKRHHVDLDLETGGLRRIDAPHDLAEITPSGDGAKLIWVKRVERDIDALDTLRLKLGRVFSELRAVGGERELFERAGREMPR